MTENLLFLYVLTFMLPVSFFLLLKAYITHCTFSCLTMVTSYIIHNFISSHHLSLLTSCLCNIQWRKSLQLTLFLAATLFSRLLSCFMHQMVVQFTCFLHPSNRVSFSRLELKIESEHACFNASLVVHFAGVPFFVSKFIFFSPLFLSLQSWRRDLILRPPS